MTELPLKLTLAATLPTVPVQTALAELETFLRDESDIQVVAIDRGDGVDYGAIETDLVIVLGGDGAILRACRQMGARQFPILGINLGRLGFLADLSPVEFTEHFPHIRQREFKVVNHLMYECVRIRKDGTRTSYLGLNEVVVAAGSSFRMIDVELSIDEESVTTYSGDGLIVSTPVGSTAHNLSAGGPILQQDLQAFVVTPICPHTLTIRPVVDSADRVYRMSVIDGPPGVNLVIDGQIRLPFESGERIEIRRAPVSFQLAKVPGCSYYGTLFRKLGWGGQPRYRKK